MTARKRRRSRGLPAILLLVAWILVAAALAHPTPGAALGLVFVAGLVTGGAIVYHSPTSPRPSRTPERAAARRPASPPGAAATAGPASAPSAGPAPRLRSVPPPGSCLECGSVPVDIYAGGRKLGRRPACEHAQEALRADLAAAAERVSTRIPKPPGSRERQP